MRCRLLISVLLTGWASILYAVDHSNLDEGRPLRLQDAYSIAEGEIAMEAGGGFSLHNESSDKAVFSLHALYGLIPNLQIGIGASLQTDPHEIDEPEKSGDLSMEALYNFNQETLNFPAFGLKGSVELPTGVDSSGVDFKLMGIMTKSFGRLGLHLNGGYEFMNAQGSEKRDGRYVLVFGPSYPLGAPLHTRTTLLADFFVEQALQKDESDTLGGEIGFRLQLTERAIVDAGLGSEIDGPEDRSQLFGALGVSYAF